VASETRRSFDVAVVGGGVIGLTIAWRAARRGLAVTVLDRGRPGSGSSFVAAGMLAPIAEALATEQPLLRLGLRSAELYPAFLAELAEDSKRDPGYLPCGTLLLARDRDDAEALERELAMRRRLGLAVSRLRGSEARALEPALAPAVRLALEIPDDHVLDPRRLTAALADAVSRAGGSVRSGTAVAAVASACGRVTGVVLADGEEIAAEQVVIAAGPWAESIEGLPEGARIPIHPIKGQIMRLHDPAGPGLLSRVLRYPGGYVAPRGDGRYVIGATMEERGFDTTVTAGAVFELLRDAAELLPGVAELVIDELSAGLRPATPDNTPAIGAGALPGLHWAVGHYRGGILLAPVTAEIVLASLTGSAPSPLAAECDPGRFTGVAVGA
jgi:glycine oxidase